MIVIDSNVLLDLVTPDSAWSAWSAFSLNAASEVGPLIINEVIYAEVSVRLASVADVDRILDELRIDLQPLSRAALVAVGKAHGRYRENRGPYISLLPDFFVGAQAADLSCPIVTRDVRRYRSYFPEVQLITP